MTKEISCQNKKTLKEIADGLKAEDIPSIDTIGESGDITEKLGDAFLTEWAKKYHIHSIAEYAIMDEDDINNRVHAFYTALKKLDFEKYAEIEGVELTESRKNLYLRRATFRGYAN